MRHEMDCLMLFQSCDNFDFTITKKSEVVYRPAPGKPYQEPTINYG